MTDDELIKAVAEEVMGWNLDKIDKPDEWYWFEGKLPRYLRFSKKEWNPLLNANHWMMVVERMQELGFNCYLRIFKTDCESIFFGPGYRNHTAQHMILGHAVCEAALKAVRNNAGK